MEWKTFLRKHWYVAALFGIGAVVAFVGSIYVLLWYVSNAQSSGMVPSTLGLWSMSNLVTFVIYGVLWELLFIGIAVAIFGVLAWQWWTRLPPDEKRNFRFHGRKRTTGSGGGSLLFFIVFAIKVYLDGKWHDAISTYTLDYVVSSAITILLWGLVIFGVPAAIGLTWWVNHEMKNPSPPNS